MRFDLKENIPISFFLKEPENKLLKVKVGLPPIFETIVELNPAHALQSKSKKITQNKKI